MLPFGNLSGAKEDDYFSDGLTEEMITQITRLQASELAVIARTTAEHYDSSSKSLEQMKKDLGVGYVLEGKVGAAAIASHYGATYPTERPDAALGGNL